MSQLFKDAQKREWKLDMNAGVLKELQEQTGIDLMTPAGISKAADAYVGKMGPPLIMHSVYVCCRQQCEERGIDDTAFAKLLAEGDTFGCATRAFLRTWRECMPKRFRKLAETLDV